MDYWRVPARTLRADNLVCGLMREGWFETIRTGSIAAT
ncbi:protein of unknown function [Paraburkholderia dioscoreae]|uniref:Uncharacterized protein n=1 Tax=Paraburkholderia dioscoreae TaxID=2604047 RepID=A0A5Q4ZM37_9BURK|nr:protein of unknown function [Paraburkholderia dioscoreae]